LRIRNFKLNKSEIFNLEKDIKLRKKKVISTPYYDENVKKYRLFYVKYADYWILLTNADLPVIEKMKSRTKEFLSNSLGAQLFEEKWVITDTRKRAAHLLGFEIASHKNYKKTEDGLRRISSFPLIFRPDRSRLINRLHARGFCNKRGFPVSIPWLTGLEATVTIERFNATIRDFMVYYTECISRPSDLQRWVYILRYSCFKTLAHKYKTSISKIIIRFGVDRKNTATKTIQATAVITIVKISFEKGYKLDSFAYRRNEC
jgi:hypothetical protein